MCFLLYLNVLIKSQLTYCFCSKSFSMITTTIEDYDPAQWEHFLNSKSALGAITCARMRDKSYRVHFVWYQCCQVRPRLHCSSGIRWNLESRIIRYWLASSCLTTTIPLSQSNLLHCHWKVWMMITVNHFHFSFNSRDYFRGWSCRSNSAEVERQVAVYCHPRLAALSATQAEMCIVTKAFCLPF